MKLKEFLSLLYLFAGTALAVFLATLYLDFFTASHLEKIKKLTQDSCSFKYFIKDCPSPENCILINRKSGRVQGFYKGVDGKWLRYNINKP